MAAQVKLRRHQEAELNPRKSKKNQKQAERKAETHNADHEGKEKVEPTLQNFKCSHS